MSKPKHNPYFETQNRYPAFDEIIDNATKIVISMVIHEYGLSYDELVEDVHDFKHLMSRFMVMKLLHEVIHMDKYHIVDILHYKNVSSFSYNMKAFDRYCQKDRFFKQTYDKLVGYLEQLYRETENVVMTEQEHLERVTYSKL